MTSANAPLFSLIAGPSADPSDYTSASSSSSDGDTKVCAQKTQFWLESHALSCVQNSTLQSSAQRTFRDVMPPSLTANNSQDEFEFVKRIISGESCAHVAADGAINNDQDSQHYKTAVCQYTKNRSAASQSLSSMTNEQILTIGRCAAYIVTNNNSQRRRDAAVNLVVNNQKDSASGNGWFQSPVKVAKKVSSVINYAIDSALNIYDGGDYYTASANDDFEGADVDDAAETIDALSKISFDDNLDDEQTRRHGGNTVACTIEDEIDTTDDVISISAVAMACNYLLQYSQRMKSDDSQDVNDFFMLGGNIGEVERIVLERNGWIKGSLGSLCRHAGNFYTSSKDDVGSDKDTFLRVGIGKILSTISTEGVDLLAASLCQSNYAIVEENTITFFPGGIPSGLGAETTSKSDYALYQIHVTKIATHNRIRRLEKDAETAKNNAISYQKKKMTKVALVHMRRRKAALEEIDRCATILENLIAGELRLERAKGDVQVVQSYTQLKEALQDVRESSGMDNEDVEELMNDIREEMELANNDALTEGVYNADVIDEDELYEEFRLLELECESKSQSPRKSEVTTDEKVDFSSSKEGVNVSTQSPSADEEPQKSPARLISS